MQEINLQVASFLIFIISIIAHEVAHGYAALRHGDTTARDLGRLSPNPFRHIDMIGSVILPLFLFLANLPVFGWAKPVPYNPSRLRGRFATAWVASAGLLVNLLFACIFALLFRSGLIVNQLTVSVVAINAGLFLFNLLPFPPLDGFKLLREIFPSRFFYKVDAYPLQTLVLFFLCFSLFGSYFTELFLSFMRILLGISL
jgi:Zn-dependent protease